MVYAKYRLPDGRQVQKKIGLAWTERGRSAQRGERETIPSSLRDSFPRPTSRRLLPRQRDNPDAGRAEDPYVAVAVVCDLTVSVIKAMVPTARQLAGETARERASSGCPLVLGIELKHQPVLSHKLEVMPSRGPLKPEEIETWQIRAEAELTRLRSLTDAQLGAEVMRRGFADLPGDGERTRIGLSNSLCPDAPPVVGGDDINVVEQYNGLLAPVLSALEDAGLLSSQPRGRSALRFYSLTTRGRSALGDDGVETILAARS